MLTVEMLRQNSALANVEDSALQVIAEMSKNDENNVIGTRIGELHGQYDADVFSITEVKKNDGEKSYDYVKRVLGSYKDSAAQTSAIKSQLEEAKSQVASLQEQIEAQKGNEALAQQLKDSKAQVAQLQAQLTSKDAALLAQKEEHANVVKNIFVDQAFKSASASLKFKSGISETIQKTLLDAAKSEILSKGTPDLVEDAAGNKVLVLRDSAGNVLNNPKTNLNPYTIGELLLESSIKDVLDFGRQQKGAGTGDKGGKTAELVLDLSGIKSQVEADKAIASYLLSKGITRDSQEFSSQSLKIREENNIKNLPIR